MVFFNYALRKLNAKIVYYGPGLCGKTTNLQWIHDHFEGGDRGKMISLATEGDRTIFFDLLPIDIGSIRGMEVTLQLYTVPGQVHYNSTRQLVLKGADGVVFVADSQRAMHQSNLESLDNLAENLSLQGIDLPTFPHVLQFNKRDLGDLASVEELNNALNQYSTPIFEAVATEGIGVQETLEGIVKLVMRSLRERYEPAGMSGRPRSAPRPASRPPATPAVPKQPVAVAPVTPPVAASPVVPPQPAQPVVNVDPHRVAPIDVAPEAPLPSVMGAPQQVAGEAEPVSAYTDSEPVSVPPPEVRPDPEPSDSYQDDDTAVHKLGGATESDVAVQSEDPQNYLEAAPHEDTFSDEDTFGSEKEPESVRDAAQDMVAEYLGSESVETQAPDFGEFELGAENLVADQEIETLEEDSEQYEALSEVSPSANESDSEVEVEELQMEVGETDPGLDVEADFDMSDTAKEREIDQIRAPSPFVRSTEETAAATISVESPLAVESIEAAEPAKSPQTPQRDDIGPAFADSVQQSVQEPVSAPVPDPEVILEPEPIVVPEPIAEPEPEPETVVIPEPEYQPPTVDEPQTTPAEPEADSVLAVEKPASFEAAEPIPAVSKPPLTSPIGPEVIAEAESFAEAEEPILAPTSDTESSVFDNDEPFGAPEPPIEIIAAPVVQSGSGNVPAKVSQLDENALRVKLHGTGAALAEYGQVRELDVVVPVPGQWVGNKRVTLQLRLTLEPMPEDVNDGSGGPA